MWFRCGRDVVRFGADGTIVTMHYTKPSVYLVREALDGSVWIAFRDRYRLVRYFQGAFSDVALPRLERPELESDFPVYSLAMTEDTDGQVILLTPAGLVRIVGERLTPPEPMPLHANSRKVPRVRGFLADREGNLWVGTIGMGLIRLRRAPLTAYGKDEGLSDSGFNAVFQDREGRIWLGGDSLFWFDGHRFHPVPGVTNVRAIAQTNNGDLWFGGYGGLQRWRSGELSSFKIAAAPVRAIHQDREGTLWIGIGMEERPGGLYQFREGKLDRISGISDVDQILEDRDGGLWLGGTNELIQMRGGKTLVYDHKQGLPDHSVDIHQDSTGAIWIASYGGGLTRLRDGRLKTITTRDGLPNNMLAGMLEDSRGNFWVGSTQDIFRLSVSQLNDLADGKISSILPVFYGVAEGLRSSESDVGSPAGWETSDGRIWFPTMRGVVAIDPAAGNRIPPPVLMEEAWANKLPLAHEGRTSVPPGNSTLDFRFTALSFSDPDKLRFKYRLEPFDKDWVDAGTRRSTHYTNMGPGEYSFHVLAANNFGVWSNQEASVHFRLEPHFYETNWFRALCGFTLVAILWSAYRLRVRVLEHRHAVLERHQAEIRALNEQMIKAQEAERMRIAGELHDGVLQQITSIVLRLGIVKTQVPPDSEAKTAVGGLQKQLINIGTDIRHMSHELHPALLQEAGLPAALAAYCEEFSKVRGLPVLCVADETVNELSPGAALCLYRIAQEALGNAAKYSHASKVDVQLTRSNGLVRLTVSDDGIGCDPDKIGKSRGLGVISMRERVLQLHGTFEFDSALGRGTTVRAEIPFRPAT
jgi:signal transduction histidine kinase/ligand-binding sensor domain-containing protein